VKRKKTPFALPSVAPADPSLWSAKSQQSYAFWSRTFYEDIAYRCHYCGVDAVFTAREQKIAYETKKTHIDVRRVLCAACFRDRAEVARHIARCQAQWAMAKIELGRDQVFLQNWRCLLTEHARYGARADGAAMGMLDKALARLAGTAEPAKQLPDR
jgi:hypothetical protein